MVETQVNKMRKGALLALIKEEGIKVKGASTMFVKDLRSLVIEHFNDISAAKEKHISRKPFAVFTDKQIVNMASKLGWKEDIAGGGFGWQLKAIQVAACIPSTHEEMVTEGKRLTGILNPTLRHTNVPRLHYAKKSGGLDSRYTQETTYYPGKFAERTGLGGGYGLKCAEHTIRYTECNSECRIGVVFGDEWAYKLLRAAKGSKMLSRKLRTANLHPTPKRKVSNMSDELKRRMG